MVFLSLLRFCESSKHLTKRQQLGFIDSLRLNVKGGQGGSGLPKYGGVGGQGGCVYFVADEKTTLRNVRSKVKSQPLKGGLGEDSSKTILHGRRGADKQVKVPIGVTVVTDDGKRIGELNEAGQKCVAAGGGSGGFSGNNFIGAKGQERVVTLDLKLIADVGLVGFPNAGKSTLLKAVSRARPKIAAYPFTTIRPQIGVMEYDDFRQISMADLPGLIEGAHKNVGMGHKFLKHIERTRLLVMVVDLFGFKLSHAHHLRTCLQNVFALNKELEMYDKELMQKPCILLLNKMDEEGAQAELENVQEKVADLEAHASECPDILMPEQFIKFNKILPISAKTGAGIQETSKVIRDVLDEEALKKLHEAKLKINDQ